MQHHDWQTGIARADIDDVKRRAVDRDHPALGWKGTLHGDDSGLRDQRQQHQLRVLHAAVSRREPRRFHSKCQGLWICA